MRHAYGGVASSHEEIRHAGVPACSLATFIEGGLRTLQANRPVREVGDDKLLLRIAGPFRRRICCYTDLRIIAQVVAAKATLISAAA